MHGGKNQQEMVAEKREQHALSIPGTSRENWQVEFFDRTWPIRASL